MWTLWKTQENRNEPLSILLQIPNEGKTYKGGEEMKMERKIHYEWGGKNKGFTLIECDEQITTVCQVVDDTGETFDIEVVSEGMDFEQICRYFPPKQEVMKNLHILSVL